MKLPRFTARTPPPRISGLARATDIGALTRTGDIEVWRGVSQWGGAMRDVSGTLFKIQQDRHALDTRLQHAQFTTDVAGYVNEFNRSLTDTTIQTPLQRDSMHKSAMTQLDKYYQQRLRQVDNEDARQAIKISWMQDRLRYDDQMHRILTKQLDIHQVDIGLKTGEAFLENGNVEAAIEHYKALGKHNLITKDYMQRLIREAPKKAEEYLVAAQVASVWEVAKIMPYKEAISYINDMSELEQADRNDLIARRKRKEEIDTATHDPKVYMPLLRKLTKDSDSVSEEDIWNAYGRGIDEADYKELIKIKQTKDDPLKASSFQIYSGILDALYPGVTKPEKLTPEKLAELTSDMIQEYDQKNTELKNFAIANPDANPKQWREKFDEVTADIREEKVRGYLDKYVGGFGRFIAGGGVVGVIYHRYKGEKESEPAKPSELPFPEYPDAYEENGIWYVMRDGKRYRIEK